MAQVETKSTPITNLEATPVVKQTPDVAGGKVREAVGVITTNSDDSIGSIYRFCRVPSNARVSQILGSHDVDSASAGAGNVGLYQTTENGGAVVDVDFFASAWDFNVLGDASNVDLTHEAGAGASYLVAEGESRIWELLGLSEDPNLEYDVCITLTEAVAGGACVLGVKARYALDN